MFVLIVNPTAGGGSAAQACQGICRLLRERGISYRIENTNFAGHGTELARNAAASGCDGLMIEVHNNPRKAWCDGAQSLTPEQFSDVASRVRQVLEVIK